MITSGVVFGFAPLISAQQVRNLEFGEKKCSGVLIFLVPDGDWFADNRPKLFYDKLVRWTCKDECSYECMWRATDAFLDRGWKMPQFFGKVRIGLCGE